LTWTDAYTTVPNPVAGQVSGFSSLGPTAELDFKPDLGAPGGNIWSTYPVALGSYATLSGTSMASPHVAGSVALLLEARPHARPEQARDLLQNTAVPTNYSTSPYVDSVHRQGAGLIHIDRAATTEQSVAPAKLALGDGTAGPVTRTLAFKNAGADDVTYDLSNVTGLTTGPSDPPSPVDPAGEFTPFLYVGTASAAFSPPTVTVPAGGSAQVTVTITITQPTTAKFFIYGGYLVATPRAAGMPLRVPYLGVSGDYQATPVLGAIALTHADGAPVTDGDVFTLADTSSMPRLVFELAHSARRFKAEVFVVQPGGVLGKDWHLAAAFEYGLRNSTPTGRYAFFFDGMAGTGKTQTFVVPNGSYVIQVTVEKPLGTDATDEVWQSPVFTIARP
jgi:hypothetical protein